MRNRTALPDLERLSIVTATIMLAFALTQLVSFPAQDYSKGKTEYQVTQCIHQLFEEQAARAPNAVAVVADDRTYTYRELDHAARMRLLKKSL